MSTLDHVTPTVTPPAMTIQERDAPVPGQAAWRRWMAVLAGRFSARPRANSAADLPYLVHPLRLHRERKK